MDDKEPVVRAKDHTSDYLANERTFLAWIRTGLAAISLGFVIARFSFWLRQIAISAGDSGAVPKPGLSLPIGLAMVVFGALICILSTLRYHVVNNAIRHGGAEPSTRLVVFMTSVLVLLAIAMFIYLVAAS